MLELNNITLSRGGENLIQKANTRIHAGQRIGLVGRNGSGKSTLLAMLRHEIEPDTGEFSLPVDWRVASVRQETPSLQQPALDYVLSGHEPYQQALRVISVAEDSGDGVAIGHAYEQFSACDGYAQPARAGELLSGLGFLPEQHLLPVADFSGGWRMRLNLAQALISPAEVLLLDEPTNHLDLDAVIWLQDFLKNHHATQIIIAHDRDFLDALCTRILHIENREMREYSGNYSDFERQRHEHRLQADAYYQQQVRQRAHLQSFVERFRAKATKARQAQSRLKALEKLNAAPPPPPENDYQLLFPTLENQPNPILIAEGASLGYQGKVILENIKLRLSGDARIGLLGRNGAGKSTLMKGLAGVLQTLAGNMESHKNARIGYFTQHQLDALRPDESALWHIKQIIPNQTEQQHRNFLGGYGFQGTDVSQPVQQFSGGEKARLALALIIAQKPNVLLLDEPTNHLDISMRDALTESLQTYQGAMVLISHDRSLLTTVCDEFYLVAEGKVEPFQGDLEDYRRYLATTVVTTRPVESEKKENRSTQRQAEKASAAEKRQKLRPYKLALEKAEKSLDKISYSLKQVEEKLADNSLYEEANKSELKMLLDEQIELKKQLNLLEAEWLSAAEDLQNVETQLSL